MTKQEFLLKHTGNGDIARKDLDELIKRYCREQREICADRCKDQLHADLVIDAPTPDL